MYNALKSRRVRNGGILLAIGCYLLSWWLRSLIVSDEVVVESGGSDIYLIRSADQSIQFVHRTWLRGALKAERSARAEMRDKN
jgi:hypothetical protein